MRHTINVSKVHIDGIIKDIDESKYFQLDKSAIDRSDLFDFALALGLREETPTPLKSSTTFIRVSYVEKKMFIYRGIYYDKYLKDFPNDIDSITDDDKVLDLVEEYANTGFYKLAELKEEFPDDNLFMLKLLHEMDSIQKEYINQYQVSTLIRG